PPLVDAFVDVARVVDALRQIRHADAMPRLGRSDEVVERDVQPRPRLPELLLHPIAVDERIEPLLDRLLVDVLRVLVVAHQEARLEPAEALVAGNDVGTHLLVGRPEVGPAVHVVDGSRQKVARHDDRYAAVASACTSLTGMLFAAASRAQSSNSGV